MTAPLIRIELRTVILILSGLIGLHTVLASDELTLPFPGQCSENIRRIV